MVIPAHETDLMYSVKSTSPRTSNNVFAIQKHDQARASTALDLDRFSAPAAPFTIVLPLRLACASRMQRAVRYAESVDCQRNQVKPAHASLAMILETKADPIRKQYQATPQVLACLLSTNGQQVSRHFTTSADIQRLLSSYGSRRCLDAPYRGEEGHPGILESPSIDNNSSPPHTITPVRWSFTNLKHASMKTFVKNELTKALIAGGLCSFLRGETVSISSFSLNDPSITVLSRMDGFGENHLRLRTKPLSLAADPFDVWLYQSLCCWMPGPATMLLHQSLTTHNATRRAQAWHQEDWLSCLGASLYACLHKGTDLSELGLVARFLDHGAIAPNGSVSVGQDTSFNAAADATDANESQTGRQKRDSQGSTPAEEYISEQTTSPQRRKRRRVGPGKDDPPDDGHDDRSKKNDGGSAQSGHNKEKGKFLCPEYVYQVHYHNPNYRGCSGEPYDNPAHVKQHVKDKHFKNLLCSNHLECQGRFTFDRSTRKLVHESSIRDCPGLPCGPEDAMMSGETMKSIYKPSKGPFRHQWRTMFAQMHPGCLIPSHEPQPVIYLRAGLLMPALSQIAERHRAWLESDEGFSAEQKERSKHKLRNIMEQTVSSYHSQSSGYSDHSSTQYDPALNVQETTSFLEPSLKGYTGFGTQTRRASEQQLRSFGPTVGVHGSAPDSSLASTSATLLQDDMSNSLPTESIETLSSTGGVPHEHEARADPNAARLPMSMGELMLNSAGNSFKGNQGASDGFVHMTDVYDPRKLSYAHSKPMEDSIRTAPNSVPDHLSHQGEDISLDDTAFDQWLNDEFQDTSHYRDLAERTNGLVEDIEDPKTVTEEEVTAE